MTDITDQAIRDMLEWARIAVASKDNQEHEPWVTAARYILATVPAPAPTLAEELRHIAEHWEEWATDTITSAIRAAADRAEQTEQDRDEASSEVKRLTAELETEPVALEVNVATDQQANMQGILAGSLPDPADVKPGEAWIVKCHTEVCTAVKGSTDDLEWKAVSPDGFVSSEGNEDVTLVTRLVPAPRVITNPIDLDGLAEGTIIRDQADGEAMQKRGIKWVPTRTEHHEGFYSYAILPATVLWEPEV